MPPKRKVEAIEEADKVLHFMRCCDASSDKFYELTLSGKKIISRYGKSGSHGTSVVKEFPTVEEALEHASSLMLEKKKKGYKNAEAKESEAAVAAPPAKKPTVDKTKKTGAADPSLESSSIQKQVVYLECTEGGSRKFYEMVQHGDDVTIRYGKIGTDGVKSEKNFNGDAQAAADFVTKTTGEKERKGYEVPDAGATSDVEVEIVDPVAPRATTAKPSAKSAKSAAVKAEKLVPVPVPVTVLVADTMIEKTVSAKDVYYLECKEGGSSKFYEVVLEGDTVSIRYGKIGTDGVQSVKSFAGDSAGATKFAMKTVGEKERKGYSRTVPTDTDNDMGDKTEGDNNNDARVESSGNLAEDLERGLKVHIKGSSALPYTLKKFNGGYSCSCQGWAMHVQSKGIQATSCKHLKLVRGEETEAERCAASAGAKPPPSGGKNTTIAGMISLAQQWNASTDPTGNIMSEKLDGMRAYWCGKKLWTRSGLPILAPGWFTKSLPADLALDGELFLGRQMFDACMSIARRTDASNDWQQLSYVVFDAPTIKGGIMTRLERAQTALETCTAALDTTLTTLDRALYWKIHPQTVCQSMEHLLDELAIIEAQNGEGLMLRSASAAHRGGRSSDLLKVKSFHDDEALVTAHEDGKGKYQGQVGSLVCVSRRGARFKVGSGLTDAMRSARAAPAPGTVISFKYFELTKDGIPRFPTFLRVRPDVEKSEFPNV